MLKIPGLFVFWKNNIRQSLLLLFILLGLIGLAISLDRIGNGTFFIILVALISLFPFLYLFQKKPLFNYLIICLLYILGTYKFLFSDDLPIWDSWSYHFPAFKYIGDAIANGHLFPQWFPVSGGVRIGFFHIQLFTTLPHRILGYFLYSILPISPLFIYKLQYIIGVVFMCFGWWLVLQKVTKCRYSSYFGTLMVMMGGTGITFHQEQLLATTYLIPWFVLSLLKIRENSYYIFPAVILFGLGLNTHNIQIQYISMGLIIILLLLFYPALIKIIYHEQRRFLPLFVFLFILAILPSYYLYQKMDILSSSVRGIKGEYFHPKTYEEYLGLSAGNFSSAIPSYFRQYIKPEFINDLPGVPVDRCAFFVGRIALLLMVFGILFRFKKAVPIFVLLIIFTGLTLGVNCKIPIPKYLYYLHVPFIDVFRQWYHFSPLINFSLSALSAIGFSSLVQYSKGKHSKIFSILVPSLLFFQILDLVAYDRAYCYNYSRKDIPPEFSNYLFSKENYNPTNIFQYKNRFRLYHVSNQAIPTEMLLTTNIISEVGGVEKELEQISDIVSKGGDAAVVNIPPIILQDSLTEHNKYSTKVTGFSSICYDGVLLDMTVPSSSFLVTPLNYDLGLMADVDGMEVKVWRVNSAFCGILVKEGKHKIKFRIVNDIYLVIVYAQIVLYVFLGIFFYLYWRR